MTTRTVVSMLIVLIAPRAYSAPCPTWPSTSSVNATQFGAKGDGVRDDTASIQAAIDAVPQGGTLYIPPGTYLMAVGQSPKDGVKLKSNMTLWMDAKAVLKAIPTKDSSFAMMKAWSVSRLRVFGGTLLGERDTHIGTTGEWGMNLDLRDSNSVEVVGLTSKNAWGDGIYVGGKSNSNVSFCGIVADGNRRNGMSIITADGLNVLSSRFTNNGGTSPQAGLDIEPNPNNVAQHIVVADSVFKDNQGPGIALSASCMNCGATNQNNTVRNNEIIGNLGEGIYVSFDDQTIDNNRIDNSGRAGIRLIRAINSTVHGNTVSHSKQGGIQIEQSTNNRIEANILASNQQEILIRWSSKGNHLSGNSCAGHTPTIQRDNGSVDNDFENNSGCRW